MALEFGMAKILAIIKTCKECPNRHYYSGGAYECELVHVMIPSDTYMPSWCPLPNHPAAHIADLEQQLAAKAQVSG